MKNYIEKCLRRPVTIERNTDGVNFLYIKRDYTIGFIYTNIYDTSSYMFIS